MKKRHLIQLFALPLLFGIGVSISVVQNSNKPVIVARAEDNESEDDLTTLPIENPEEVEEESDLKKLYDEVIEKYNELKDIQVAGTTLGAIVGAIIGAIVSAIPAIFNRNNIHKAIDQVNITRGYVDDNRARAEKVKELFNITNENYDKALICMNALSKELGGVEKILKDVIDDNKKLHCENNELKEILLTIATNSKELVGNAVAEELLKKYGDK